MEFGDRLKELIAFKNLNYRSLAKKLDYSDVQVRKIALNKSVPKIDFIQSLLRIEPLLNLDWLLTGKGDKFKSNLDFDLNNEVPVMILLKYLLDRKDELIDNETYRDYIRANYELIMADDEREKKNKALEELRKIALKRHKK